jgi:hypothetical protein
MAIEPRQVGGGPVRSSTVARFHMNLPTGPGRGGFDLLILLDELLHLLASDAGLFFEVGGNRVLIEQILDRAQNQISLRLSLRGDCVAELIFWLLGTRGGLRIVLGKLARRRA